MDQNNNDEIEIDLLELFQVIRARVWIIILTGVLTATSAGLISNFLLTPIYTSTTKLYILNKSTSITSLALQDLQLGAQLTQDYMVLVKSRPVVTQVIDNLELNMKYEDMVSIISISNPTNTRILELTAEYPDPYLAKRIVDEFAAVSTSRIAKIMDTSEPTVVEEGYMETNPSSPNVKKNIIIGGLIGLFLAAGIIIVLHLLDDTIKDSDDIEKYLGLNTLGLIPVESGGQRQMEQDKRKRKIGHKKSRLKGKMAGGKQG
jgi:capsular polysaccharide biosynthesis protein